MGSHVLDCPNHQTGRSTPLETRGHVAISGIFGYVLYLTKLTAEEKETVKAQCDEYRKHYDLINKGELYLLYPHGKTAQDALGALSPRIKARRL